MYGKFEFYDHHNEHEFATVKDHIESVTNKLKAREDSAEHKIENIEDIIKKVSILMFLLIFLFNFCHFSKLMEQSTIVYQN